MERLRDRRAITKTYLFYDLIHVCLPESFAEIVAIGDLPLGHIDKHVTDLKHLVQIRLPVCVGI